MPKNGFKIAKGKVQYPNIIINVHSSKMYRHYGDGILRENGEIAEFDIWADSYEVEEFQTSILEMADTSMEPSETAKESVSSHKIVKTTRKSNKKKSKEQRAKKKSNRTDIVPDNERVELEEYQDYLNWKAYLDNYHKSIWLIRGAWRWAK